MCGVLPLELLVRVGKEIGGQAFAGLVAGGSRGLDEGADVGDDGGGIAVEERLDVRKVGVEGEVGVAAAELEELVLRKGQRAADGGVVVVAGGVELDEGVVGVVAAEEEDADEGLVVRGKIARGH